MRYSRILMAATGLAAVIGFAAPASAGVIAYPVTLANPTINSSLGQTATGITPGSVTSAYAGLIAVDLKIGSSSTPIVVFCDDLYNDINVNHGQSYSYWTSYDGTVAGGDAGASAYLSPASANFDKIAGLDFLWHRSVQSKRRNVSGARFSDRHGHLEP